MNDDVKKNKFISNAKLDFLCYMLLIYVKTCIPQFAPKGKY